MKGFEQAEKTFIQNVKPNNILSDFDHSGSCAIVVIIVGKKDIFRIMEFKSIKNKLIN